MNSEAPAVYRAEIHDIVSRTSTKKFVNEGTLPDTEQTLLKCLGGMLSNTRLELGGICQYQIICVHNHFVHSFEMCRGHWGVGCSVQLGE